MADDEHVWITHYIAEGDFKAAARLLMPHIDNVEAGSMKRIDRDALIDPRAVLQPSISSEKGLNNEYNCIQGRSGRAN